MSVAYSPSGQQIASGSHDNTVRLWDAETGAPGPILSGHTKPVRSMVYSPSGQQIASGSQDKTVRLWDAQTGAPGPILRHTSYIMSVVYSPSGQQIASGIYDHTVRLWNVQTGAPGPILSGHTKSVRSVAYSPSGQQIASISDDYTVRLWDVDLGQCLAVVNGFNGYVTSIAWNATLNGTYFATGCDDKSVRVWKVIEEDDRYKVLLHWSTMHDSLFVSDTSIQNAQGLNRINMRLLEQRGAVGVPIPPSSFRETGKKLISMASVASKLKMPSNHSMLDTFPMVSSPAAQSAKPVDSANVPPLGWKGKKASSQATE
ncbi:WD40-repeat-containing domain protein [Gamsiella multidivaricata]|uniref:WD40-repeat-containing domain protein n=1 Tax=Gamsiella multidivaricata TaxID=101098 RepID=UPI00222091F8|nr:WD40-repeat-containing domain protein [Gamsiella multidivaricata]KAI7830225.1 WD40-repeat-containing domain protein [Gamsiella multidivaricata]